MVTEEALEDRVKGLFLRAMLAAVRRIYLEIEVVETRTDFFGGGFEAFFRFPCRGMISVMRSKVEQCISYHCVRWEKVNVG